MSWFALKFNNGNPLVLHGPTGDSVLVSELGLHTEYELEVLRNKLDDLRSAFEKALAESEARYVAQTDALLKVEREAHARTLAAARDALAQMGGRPKSCGHEFECICVGDNLKAAIAAAKVTP